MFWGETIKGNDATGYHITRDDWQTPDYIFKPLEEQYDIGFDCCSSSPNLRLPYSTDFLKEIDLDGYICWMNPPFSKALEMFIHFFKVVIKGVAIYRCDNFETNIWQNVIFPNATWIFIPDKRVSYVGLDGNGSRFPSALIGKNLDPPKNIKGILLYPQKNI